MTHISPLNKEVSEIFSFGGQVVSASRLYCNTPMGERTPSIPSLPSLSEVRATSWSPDGRYLAVASSDVSASTSSLTVYRYNGESFVKLSAPATIPGATTIGGDGTDSYSVAFSPSGDLIAVTHETSPFLSVYIFLNEVLTKIPDPDPLPAPSTSGITDRGTGVVWSPDGTYLAVSSTTSPYVYIYRIAAFGSAIIPVIPVDSNYATLTQCVDWSPDGRFIVVGYSTPPYFAIFEFLGNQTKKIPEAETEYSMGVGSAQWSPDGRFLAIGSSLNPHIYIYSFDGKKATFLTSPSMVGVEGFVRVAWSPCGRYLAFYNDTTPYFAMFSFDGKELTQLELPRTTIIGLGIGLSWHPSGSPLVLTDEVYQADVGYLAAGSMLLLDEPSNSPF